MHCASLLIWLEVCPLHRTVTYVDARFRRGNKASSWTTPRALPWSTAAVPVPTALVLAATMQIMLNFPPSCTLCNGRNRPQFNARSAARCGVGDDFQDADSCSRCLVRLVCITHDAGQLAAVSIRRGSSFRAPDASLARRHEQRSSTHRRLHL